MSSAPIIRFAVNTQGVDKTWDFERLTSGFKDTQGTLHEVKDHIKKGHAVCAGLLNNRRKNKANVIGSQWLLLDIDNSTLSEDRDILGEKIKVYSHQLSIEEAQADPFIRQYCGLAYTTASHTALWHRFRLVFPLPYYVEGAANVEACIRKLMKHLPHDPACKDASRVFYGSTKADFVVFNPDACLPEEWVNEAITEARLEEETRERQRLAMEAAREEFRRAISEEGWDKDQLIQQALSFIPQRSPGSGTYQESLTILMALYSEYGASGETIAEIWSPSIKGTTWDISKKFRSFRGSRSNPVTIGSLFHIAKQYGFKFPKRQKWTTVNNVLPLKKDEKPKRGVRQTSVPIEAPQQEQYTAFIYKAGDRIKTWSSNIMENHKVQLDTSPVGTGKSYTVGELVEEVLPKFTTHKIILVTTDPRNVTTDTLKSWPVLEGRHDGLVEQLLENSKGGFERHIRRKKIRPSSIDTGVGAPDEQKKEVVLANCDRAELSQILIAKNVTPSADSVCTGCPFKKQCHSGSGQFNFLHQRQEVMKQQRFIAHPSALSPDTIEEGTLLIFDEASRLEWVKSYVATLGDVSRTGMELLNPDATEEETEFFDIVSRLWSLMNNSLPNEYKLYGMPHHKVLESVLSSGEAPKISAELIEQLSEQSTEYMSEYEEFYGADAQSNKALRKVRQFLQAKEQLIKQAQNMRLRWLPDFYQALMGTPGYRLHLNVDGLHITTPNKHLKALIKAEGVYSILLDATEHADFFEKVLDEKIVEVRQEEPESAKIKIVQVFGNGRCGYSRRDRQQRRQEAVIEAIQAKHGKLPVIEIGKYAKEGQSKWVTDSRGRNHLETAPGLIISGIASMNISAAADKFSALFGRPVNVDDRVMRTYPVLTTNTTEHWSVTLEEAQDDEFAQWYRRQTLAELHQAIGRLRATRRAGEDLTVFLLTDYPIDLEVEFTHITDWISLEPTTDDRIEEAIQKLQQDNAQITTRAIASLANCAPGTVSKSKAYQSYRQTLNSLPHEGLEVIPNVHIYSTSGINQNEVELDPTKRYVMDGVEGEMILISQGNGMVVLEQSVTGMTWCANVNQVKMLDV